MSVGDESKRVRRRVGAPAVGVHCTDVELIALVGRREPLALQELYRRYAPLLFAVARRAGGTSVADSITAALFLQLWADPASFTPVAGSLRRVLLTRMMSVVATAAPPPEERAWALLTIGECTFAETAQLLGEPEAAVRQYALAAFRARSATGGGATTR